jgi:plasmid maintenance system antidote protein VapI
MSYREVLAQYHLHPESKFRNGDYLDRGITIRRHVEAVCINYIGKEANRWEEQHFLGIDAGAQINYGPGQEGASEFVELVRAANRNFSRRELAQRMRISRETLAAIIGGNFTGISQAQMLRALAAISELSAELSDRRTRVIELLELCRTEIELIGHSQFAVAISIDPANFAKIINGDRKVGEQLLGRISKYFQKRPSSRRTG